MRAVVATGAAAATATYASGTMTALGASVRKLDTR